MIVNPGRFCVVRVGVGRAAQYDSNFYLMVEMIMLASWFVINVWIDLRKNIVNVKFMKSYVKRGVELGVSDLFEA